MTNKRISNPKLGKNGQTIKIEKKVGQVLSSEIPEHFLLTIAKVENYHKDKKNQKYDK